MDDRASGEGGPGELRLALLATSRRAGSGACMRSQSPDQMRCFVRVSCSPAPPAPASPHFFANAAAALFAVVRRSSLLGASDD
jgi:hypothetical protein